jgi:hypothetical protein
MCVISTVVWHVWWLCCVVQISSAGRVASYVGRVVHGRDWRPAGKGTTVFKDDKAPFFFLRDPAVFDGLLYL